MSQTVKINDYNATLGVTPYRVFTADAQIDWLELENRSASGLLLFYWQPPKDHQDDPDPLPPEDPDAWHSVKESTGRVSPMRHADFWVRAVTGTVHFVLTAG